jgi:hypothetical protein
MTRSLRVLLVSAAVLLAAPAGAPAATVLTSGTLTDAGGAPSAGQVRVYGWVSPKRGQTFEMPLLGTTTAGPDGRFSVSSPDDSLLRTLSSPRGGYIDFTVVGDTGTYAGTWGFTAYVDAPAGVARVSTAEDAIQARSAASAASVRSRVPDITVRAVNRTAFARAAQYGQCDMRRHVRAVGSMRKQTIVGELNNAYNDGTSGIFTYSREGTASTTIGAASQLQDGSWSISAEYTITDKGWIKFPPFNRRMSRKLRSLFEYTKYEIQASSCAVWEPYIRATSWIGDYDYSIKQDGLDKCDPRYLTGYRSGGDWGRNHGDAVRFTKAVEAFGVSLTARSGFSTNVDLRYDWRGPVGKKHYICGEDGKASPLNSGRVFTGSRK